MNKKGFLGMEEAGNASLIILALIIIIVLIGIKLFPQIKDAFFGSLPSISKDTGIPETSIKQRVPTEVEAFFNNFVTRVRNFLSSDNCLIEIGGIPKMQDNAIILNQENIQLKKISDKGLTVPEKTEYIDIKPCILSGEPIVNFYKCYLLNDKTSCDKISFPSSQITIGKSDHASFLYKSAKNICAVKIYSDLGFGCDEPKNNGESGMDNDCIVSIKSKIQNCGT